MKQSTEEVIRVLGIAKTYHNPKNKDLYTRALDGISLSIMENEFVAIEALLEGRSIHCPIEEQVVYGGLGDNEEAIWSLLVASGYLEIISYERPEEPEEEREINYEVALTNFEVKRMFVSMVRRWFYQAEAEYSDFLMALLQSDVDAMNEYRISMETFSYFDTGKKAYGSDPERFYHGFVLGLLVELRNRYIISSNRESGFGRYDLVMEPIKKYGFVFWGKEVLIGEGETVNIRIGQI